MYLTSLDSTCKGSHAFSPLSVSAVFYLAWCHPCCCKRETLLSMAEYYHIAHISSSIHQWALSTSILVTLNNGAKNKGVQICLPSTNCISWSARHLTYFGRCQLHVIFNKAFSSGACYSLAYNGKTRFRSNINVFLRPDLNFSVLFKINIQLFQGEIAKKCQYQEVGIIGGWLPQTLRGYCYHFWETLGIYVGVTMCSSWQTVYTFLM